MMESEEASWLPVPGEPGYEASSLGQVRSVDRILVRKNGHPLPLKGKLLVPSVTPSGHRSINVTRGRRRYVHQLVLEAFVGPRPETGMEACHNDGDPANNRPENLRWDTASENHKDRVRHGVHYCTARTHCPFDHSLTEPNLVKSKRAVAHRGCLACHRARAHVRHQERTGRPVESLKEVADRYHAELLVTGGAPKPQPRITHCARKGHELTPENTYVHPKRGYRVCRACKRELEAAIAQKRRAS